MKKEKSRALSHADAKAAAGSVSPVQDLADSHLTWEREFACMAFAATSDLLCGGPGAV